MGIIVAVLVIGFLVIFHELGHFLLARYHGIRVEEFALGMGPVLCRRKFLGTDFVLKLFPIGGSCAMGEDDSGDMSPDGFNSKPVWARISVIAAGPLFNLAMAYLACTALVMAEGYRAPSVKDVTEGYAAYEAGMRAGDTILSVDGKKALTWDTMHLQVAKEQGSRPLAYVWEDREGEVHEAVLEPRKLEGDANPRYGYSGPGEVKEAGFFGSFYYGAVQCGYLADYTLDSLKSLFDGRNKASDMSGVIGAADAVGGAVEEAEEHGTLLATLLNIIALLSVNLGLLNLLPIPALDGGRLLFLFIEAVRGKRVLEKYEWAVHAAGFLALMAFMLFVAYHDLVRIFS